ncbi:MAG TPA: FxLYD domain-containing protein [Candidatus Acidoferrum sp.]|nr:FxLYD domain-containing protein [Candidatus Acidoferrum sp.]
MGADKAAAQKESIPPVTIVIGLVLALGIAGFVFLDRASKQAPPPPPPLTDEAKAYVKNLRLANVDMAAHESFLKQSVVEITGEITNAGDRVLKSVDLNCVFYDPYGQAILRQRVSIVSAQMGGLRPGAMKQFRLPFDTVPETWNNVMPQLVIAGITFQ